jgi:hypothetical protein
VLRSFALEDRGSGERRSGASDVESPHSRRAVLAIAVLRRPGLEVASLSREYAVVDFGMPVQARKGGRNGMGGGPSILV